MAVKRKAGRADAGYARLRPAPVWRSLQTRWKTLACSLVLVFLIASCQKKRRPPEARVNPKAFALRLRSALLSAGGNNLWIKEPASGRFPPTDSNAPVEVLVTPAAFQAARAALRREAARSHVKLDAQNPSGSAKETGLTIRFARGKEELGIWKLRQVPRILRAAIVIDDMGANEKAAEELLTIPYPLTFSVLPHLKYSVETARQAHHEGHDVMLHLPMEPIPRPGFMPTAGEIREGMDRAQVDHLVEADLAAVPDVDGVNNHEGSQATQDPRLMGDVMQVLAARRLYFIDSRTTGGSVALQAARHAGLPSFFRSVFLDDTESVTYTLGQLREFAKVVRKQGMAVAIGHPHPTTIRALQEFLPQFSRDDIELVPVSRLVLLPGARQLEPN